MKVFAQAISLMIILLMLGNAANAQSKRQKPVPTPKPVQTPLPSSSKEAIEARSNLIAATQNYKTSLEKVVELEKQNQARVEESLAKKKQAMEVGVTSRLEVEQAQQAADDVREKIATVNRQMEEADQLMSEVAAEEQLAKTRKNTPAPSGSLQSGVVLIRYTGTTKWSLNDYSSLDKFFSAKFGHSLPVSAFGQTGVHDRLGFAHYGAMDVALHPDSVEGRALLAHLQSQGIPFIAFRAAVAGSATGAHIHVGAPSHRVGAK